MGPAMVGNVGWYCTLSLLVGALPKIAANTGAGPEVVLSASWECSISQLGISFPRDAATTDVLAIDRRLGAGAVWSVGWSKEWVTVGETGVAMRASSLPAGKR